MEILITVLRIVSFILLGFLLAEFQNAYLGKEVKGESRKYFGFIGVEFTEKDFQRLFFALFLGAGIHFLIPIIEKHIEVDLYRGIVYIVAGYSPSTIMIIIKNRKKNKFNNPNNSPNNGSRSNEQKN